MLIGSQSTSTLMDVFRIGMTEVIRATGLPQEAVFDTRGCSLVVKGKEEESGPEMSLEAALERVELYRSEGKSLKQAAKLTSEDTGYSKNALYNAAVEKSQQS